MENQIAKTIYQQLGGAKFSLMTGAKNFCADENSLNFSIGKNSTKCNRIKITYNYGADLYSMTFYSYSPKNLTLKTLKEIDGVFCDQLTELFTQYTGLYTSL